MYYGYFVNINTGQLMVTSNPKDNPANVFYPSFNVDGWSQLTEKLYNTMKLVQGFGFVEGVEAAI